MYSVCIGSNLVRVLFAAAIGFFSGGVSFFCCFRFACPADLTWQSSPPFQLLGFVRCPVPFPYEGTGTRLAEQCSVNMPSSSLSPKNTQPISAVGSSCNCCRYQLIANCSSAIPSYFLTFSPVYFLFRSSNTSSSSSLKLG